MAPIIASGQIVSTTVDVTQPPPAPLVKLQIKGYANSVTFNWTGPSGEAINQWFVGGTWIGLSPFQGYAPGGAFETAFTLYTERGTWTLTGLNLCRDTTCTYYQPPSLSSLFGGKITFKITNPNPPDIKPPVGVAGVVKTPTISLSKNPTLEIGLAATDNLSGIAYVFVCASTPSVFQNICVNSGQASSVVLSKTYFMTSTLPATTATGNYTIDNVYLSDLAGNVYDVSDAATITKLFYGRTTIVVGN